MSKAPSRRGYNRKKHRWERTMPCGRVIWTRRHRWYLQSNIAQHRGKCTTCQLLDPVGLTLKNTEVIRLRLVGDTRNMMLVGFMEHKE